MAEIDLAVDHLFGEARVNHGAPDEEYIYTFPQNKQIANKTVLKNPLSNELHLKVSNGKSTLMAQFVWQSSLTLAEYLINNVKSIENKTVLELGAGAAVPSFVSLLLSPKKVIATDYPDESIISALKANFAKNFGSQCLNFHAEGLSWGDQGNIEKVLLLNQGKFDTVIMADTLWLNTEHDKLIATLLQTSKPETGRIYCTFMHHDNKEEVAPSFLRKAAEAGLKTVHRQEIQWNEDIDPEEEYGRVLLYIFKV
eukprot:maker-scaffold_5-snap-gene-3.46-mRNA-1 protein AED:0.00 eAED:0.00 QI:16/1/1/1/1/1/2/1040/253